MSGLPTNYKYMPYHPVQAPAQAPIATESTLRSSPSLDNVDLVRRLRAYINWLCAKTLDRYRKTALKEAYITLRKSLY
jgi:hypothetical protein